MHTLRCQPRPNEFERATQSIPSDAGDIMVGIVGKSKGKKKRKQKTEDGGQIKDKRRILNNEYRMKKGIINDY